MTSSEASSPASLLASTDTEESSLRGEIKDDEDGDDKESDFLGGIRNGSWDLYRSTSSTLLNNESGPGENQTDSVEGTVEDLQKNLNEWKKHHSNLIDHFKKINNRRRSSLRVVSQQSSQAVRQSPGDNKESTMTWQDSMGEKEREITLLKKQLDAKDRELRHVSSSNTSLEESQDEARMKLADSKLSVERLERDKEEAKGEVERLRREVGEERLVRQKEKGALEKDVVQLQRKLRDSQIKQEEDARRLHQQKAEAESSRYLLNTSHDEVKQLRTEVLANRTSLTRMLGALKSATLQISSLSKQDSRPRSVRRTSYKHETSEYEAAAKEIEEEVQAHCKQWEELQSSLIRNSSHATRLSEAKKKLEEDLGKKIEEVSQLESRLKEVKDLCSRAEANQNKLEVAVAEYRTQVQSMRLETDSAKRDSQTAHLENEMLKRKLESEQTSKEEIERLCLKNVERLENSLSEERKKHGILEAGIREEKRRVQLLEQTLNQEKKNAEALERHLASEKKRVQTLEVQTRDEKRYKEEFRDNGENEGKVGGNRYDSASSDSQLNQEIEELRRENRSLSQRIHSLQARHQTLTQHLTDVTEGDIKKLGSLEKLLKQIRSERDDLETKNFELIQSSPASLTTREQASVLQDRNLIQTYFQSSPLLYGSNLSLSSEARGSALPTTGNKSHNSREFLHNGDHHHRIPNASQEAFSQSSAESEKDSFTQFSTGRHSTEPDKSSSPHPNTSTSRQTSVSSQLPGSRQPFISTDSSFPTSDLN